MHGMKLIRLHKVETQFIMSSVLQLVVSFYLRILFVIIFFEIDIDTKKRRLNAAKRLKTDLCAGMPVAIERCVIVKFENTHSNHVMGEVMFVY